MIVFCKPDIKVNLHEILDNSSFDIKVAVDIFKTCEDYIDIHKREILSRKYFKTTHSHFYMSVYTILLNYIV